MFWLLFGVRFWKDLRWSSLWSSWPERIRRGRIAGLLCRTTKISAMEKKQGFEALGWSANRIKPGVGVERWSSYKLLRGLLFFFGPTWWPLDYSNYISDIFLYDGIFSSMCSTWLRKLAAPKQKIGARVSVLGPVSDVVFRSFGNQATRYYTCVLGSELWSGMEFGVWIWNGSSNTLDGGTWWLNIGLIGHEIGPVDILDYSLFLFQHLKFGKMDIDSIWFIGGLFQKAVNCHGKESLNCRNYSFTW